MKEPGFDYAHQPYVGELLRKTRSGEIPTDPGVRLVIVEHDSWCPKLLGIGPCVCRPIVRNANRKERRALAKGKRP